jgi:hypothetical protein
LAARDRGSGERESTRLLYESAYKDYELRIEHRDQNIAPFPVLLDYHQQMMNLVHKGELTPDLVTKYSKGRES